MKLSEMDADAIAKAAYNGKELDGLCDLSDYHLYSCLCKLYADFKAGKIDKSYANSEKAKLVAAYHSDKKTTASWEKMTTEYAENIRKTSTMHPEQAKTEAECIQILAQIVAALTGDSSLPDRLRKLFGE